MKSFGLAVILSFFLTGMMFSQAPVNRLSSETEGKLYVKFGYVISFRSATAYVSKHNSVGTGSSTVYPLGTAYDLSVGIGYRFNKRLHFDLAYEYMNGLSYYESEVWKTTVTNKYSRHVSSEYKAHEFTFRANYFVNENRKEHPVYFIGGVTFSAQPVKNRFTDEDEFETVITNQSYNRFAAGPLAGVGLFWDTGIISFMTDLTIGAKFSLGNKEISETSLNLSISPIIRLPKF